MMQKTRKTKTTWHAKERAGIVPYLVNILIWFAPKMFGLTGNRTGYWNSMNARNTKKNWCVITLITVGTIFSSYQSQSCPLWVSYHHHSRCLFSCFISLYFSVNQWTGWRDAALKQLYQLQWLPHHSVDKPGMRQKFPLDCWELTELQSFQGNLDPEIDKEYHILFMPSYSVCPAICVEVMFT